MLLDFFSENMNSFIFLFIFIHITHISKTSCVNNASYKAKIVSLRILYLLLNFYMITATATKASVIQYKSCLTFNFNPIPFKIKPWLLYFTILCDISFGFMSELEAEKNIFMGLFYFGVTWLLDHCLDYPTVLKFPFLEKGPDVLFGNILIQIRTHVFFRVLIIL